VFKFEIVKKQKGYILLYTLILSFLCMLIVMLGFKLIIDEKESLYYFEKYVLKEKSEKKYIEYSLATINTTITSHVTPISKETIKNYFTINSQNPIVRYEKSYIKYNLVNDSFILTYEYKQGFLKRNEYDYDVINGVTIFTYKNSVYESGSVI